MTARVFINSTVRHKVILKSDIEDKQPEDRKILIADLPLLPVPRCLAGASVLTDIVIGKFMYHLPFYRQIQQYKEAGISISDSTMGGTRRRSKGSSSCMTSFGSRYSKASISMWTRVPYRS